MNKKMFERFAPRFIWGFATFLAIASFLFVFSSKPTLAQSSPEGIYYVSPSTSVTIPSTQTFTWNSVSGATEYWVTLVKAGKMIYDKTNGVNTTVTVSNLPQDGSSIKLQIWYKVGTVWYASNSVPAKEVTYKLGGAGGTITSVFPTAGYRLSSSQTFTWNSVAGASQYWVELKRGTKVYYDKTNGVSTTVTLGGIPQDGQNVTLAIWYKVGAAWLSQDFTYRTEATGGSSVTNVSPVANATIPSSQTFTWSPVNGASEYWVTLKKGATTLYDKSSGPNASVTISNIPQDGSTLTFQIWYKLGSSWYTSNAIPAKEVSYKAGTVSGGSSITSVTPTANTTLPASQTFTWNAVSGASQYWVTLKKGATTLYDKSAGSNTSVTISNIPQDGSTLTFQIWYKVGTVWYASVATPAKEVSYFGGTAGGCIGCTPSGILTVSPTPGTTLSDTTQNFNWNPVSGASEYWVTLKRGSTVLYDKSVGSTPMVTISNISHQQGTVLTLQIWYRVGSTWYTSSTVPAKEATYGSSPGI